MTKCKDDKHEYEIIMNSCGCEIEVCYRCPWMEPVQTCAVCLGLKE